LSTPRHERDSSSQV